MARFPKVSSREINASQLVRNSWGEQWNRPVPIYQWSNGRKHYDTDRTDSGIYGPLPACTDSNAFAGSAEAGCAIAGSPS